MRTREDCQALLASIDKMPLSVNEMAVAFENGGRSINLFPVALHDARRKRLVRQDATGLLTLTVKGRRFSPDLGRREFLMIKVRRTEGRGP
jgi:hypothetical protein